jgi:kynurenine formamidase
MRLKFGNHSFDTASGVSIAIPLDFGGKQVNAWDVPRASSLATEAGELIGDTRRGGSCNFETHTLIPHCNGTHTECVGHITMERVSISDCLKDPLMLAALVTLQSTRATATSEALTDKSYDADNILTANSLRDALSSLEIDEVSALVIRTSPNDSSKTHRLYNDDSAPYFSKDCIQLINDLGIKHIICDLPSIDRMNDGGSLLNHRTFWNLNDPSDSPDSVSREETITELAYIPESLPDGIYVLDLQIPHFVADAAPSRPILFSIE